MFGNNCVNDNNIYFFCKKKFKLSQGIERVKKQTGENKLKELEGYVDKAVIQG